MTESRVDQSSAGSAVASGSTEALKSGFGLTNREAELALLVSSGVSLAQCARRLTIAHNTARVHMASILRKTGTHSQIALVALIHDLRTGFPPRRKTR